MSKAKYYSLDRPFLKIANQRGGKLYCKCDRLRSKAISNVCQMVLPTWLTQPLNCAAPASKTMASWHQHLWQAKRHNMYL